MLHYFDGLSIEVPVNVCLSPYGELLDKLVFPIRLYFRLLPHTKFLHTPKFTGHGVV